MRRFQLYTDASFDSDKSICAAAYVLVDHNDRIYAQDVVVKRVSNAFHAEMLGLRSGLEQLPDGNAVLSHSDIRQFAQIYAKGAKSEHACIRALHALVLDKRLQFENQFTRLRQERHDFYWLCHARARLHMRSAVGRGGKTLF